MKLAVLILALAVCVYGQCPLPRVRKAWRDLGCSDRTHYINAVKALKANGEYNAFVNIHRANSAYAHGTGAFLPWHRWYIWQFENALRAAYPAQPCLTLPYWDWERDSAAASPFQPKNFGSLSGTQTSRKPSATYQCVTEGIAAYPAWVASDGVCLKRQFNLNTAFSTETSVMDILVNNPNYATFRTSLEGYPHAAPHNFVGANMATMSSPDDPLFFLHHANVDRLWALHQDFHGTVNIAVGSLTDTHYFASPSSQTYDSVMPFVNSVAIPTATLNRFSTPVTIREMMKIDGSSRPEISYKFGPDNLAYLLNPAHPWVVAQHQLVDQYSVCCCGDGELCPTESSDTCGAAPTAPTAPTSLPPTAPPSPTPAPTQAPCSCRGTKCTNCPGGRRLLAGGPMPSSDVNYQPALTNEADRRTYHQIWYDYPDATFAEALELAAIASCSRRGNPPGASAKWIKMNGMEKDQDVFKCHKKAKVKGPLDDEEECATICPMHFAPVCGSDGVTYSNSCMLTVAACTQGVNIVQVSEGRCSEGGAGQGAALFAGGMGAAAVFGVVGMKLKKRRRESQQQLAQLAQKEDDSTKGIELKEMPSAQDAQML